jgi:hypothetical protein
MDNKLPSSFPHFSLSRLFYPATLIAVSTVLFGVWGALVGTMIVGFWSLSFVLRPSLRFLPESLVVITFLSALGVLIYPSSSIPPHSKCWNNTQLIAVALHSYQAEWRSFPPAVTTDKNGRPMHSWRVLILKELGWSQLYKQYDFDEPWDGPNNRKLANKMPGIFSCPHCNQHFPHPFRQTAYVAPVGPSAAWTGDGAIQFRNISDEHHRTIFLVETPESPVNWMQPIDRSSDEIARVLANPKFSDQYDGHQMRKPFVDIVHGRAVCFVSGRVVFSAHPLDVEFAQSLLHRNDDLPATDTELQRPFNARKRWRYDRLLVLIMFLALSLYPFMWSRPGVNESPDQKNEEQDAEPRPTA